MPVPRAQPTTWISLWVSKSHFSLWFSETVTSATTNNPVVCSTFSKLGYSSKAVYVQIGGLSWLPLLTAAILTNIKWSSQAKRGEGRGWRERDGERVQERGIKSLVHIRERRVVSRLNLSHLPSTSFAHQTDCSNTAYQSRLEAVWSVRAGLQIGTNNKLCPKVPFPRKCARKSPAVNKGPVLFCCCCTVHTENRSCCQSMGGYVLVFFMHCPWLKVKFDHLSSQLILQSAADVGFSVIVASVSQRTRAKAAAASDHVKFVFTVS